MRRDRSVLYIIATFVLIVIFGLLGLAPLPVRWVLIMLVFIGLLMIAGWEVTTVEGKPGRLDGVLIDSRNKISLSRLQMVLWTVLVLSAWATFALHRVIPVAQGRLLASDIPLLRQVAELLGNNRAVGEAEMRRAAAMLEQITGAEVIIPEEGEETTALPNNYEPLDITIPTEVLLALGISVASLAGAGLIKTNQATSDTGKAQEVAAKRIDNAESIAATKVEEVETLEGTLESMKPQSTTEALEGAPRRLSQAEQEKLRRDLAKVNKQLAEAKEAEARAEARANELKDARTTAMGELQANTTTPEARWSDMLRGDTVANFQFIDLGKVQMLFFTVILIVAYGALILSLMVMPQAARVLQMTPSMSLPTFSQSVIITMALSHSGYLATKATV
jgi:hypothetical protein